MRPSVPPETVSETESDRGRTAEQPADIPAKGWWDVLWRVKAQVDEDNVSIVAAGLALFALLAVFPSLAAAVAIYGLFSSPDQIASQMAAFGDVLPEAGLKLLQDQLNQLARQHDRTLTIGVAGSILVALWSARKGMVALMTAANVAYGEHDRRGFFKRLLVSLGFTIGAVLGFIAMILLGLVVPILLSYLPLGSMAAWVILGVRWALLWAVAVIGLAIVYRHAPHRADAKWRWVTWGSATAATLWILSSMLFGLYVRNFDTLGETYGTLGGVAITLIWFYISAFVVILGAEINSEMERQTVKDTTEGEPKPMGKRHAFSADTLGYSRKR